MAPEVSFPLAVVMLSLFCLFCLYGAAASLANSVFGKELLLMGPPLLKVRRKAAPFPSLEKEDTPEEEWEGVALFLSL